MRPTIELVAMPDDTGFAPLGVLGDCLMRTSFLAPVLRAVTVPLKTVQHPPAAKLLDVLVSILAGCRAIAHQHAPAPRSCPGAGLGTPPVCGPGDPGAHPARLHRAPCVPGAPGLRGPRSS
jgi:hypothetical protein